VTSYLEGGWYGANPAKGLRTQVVDGAIDVAGSLHRAGVTPEQVLRLALRVRVAASLNRRGKLPPTVRAGLSEQLTADLGEAPALGEFVADCLPYVRDASELAALYAHVLQVARMMLVLTQAREAAVGAMAGNVLVGRAPDRRPRAAPRRVTKKKARPRARKPARKG
jgi:hypothetical protein